MTVSKEEIMERFREIMKVNSELKQSLNFCKENVKRLRDENKQLKSEIRKQSKQYTASIQKFKEENEQLKKDLFEARKDYILETYADNPVRRDEKLKALEKELEE